MIKIFSYKKKNKESIVEKFGEVYQKKVYPILINKISEDSLQQIDFDEVYDLTSLIVRTDYAWQNIVESFFLVLDTQRLSFFKDDYFFLIERNYFNDIRELLEWNSNYEFLSAEKEFKIELNNSIIQLEANELIDLEMRLDSQLQGNDYFKERLIEELKKFRLFYILGEQKIFSCLLFGSSGIGKTETAKILSNYLTPNEKLIKINLGNYSSRESLSSLIGSPRGFIGSQEGELSAKILKSESKVILIDEFEKSDKSVHNFFLELLEDGKFTDSLGREFDLSEYIIIFTSNEKKENEEKKFSPELMSRFNLRFRFSELSTQEKRIIIQKFEKKILDKLLIHYSNLELDTNDLSVVEEVNLDSINVRDLKDDVMLRISKKFFEKINSD